MDKSISARRKAQQLARDGQIQRAIAETDGVLQAGDADPYDYVFHGDLLVRARRIDEAVTSFQEAISAYEKVGLYRNAIAIAKKILRTDPSRARTYQRLGVLYAKEGLMGEAITNFLTFLDRSGGEVTGDEFLDTLERVAELSGPKVEVALRLAELYVRAGREDRAARLLEEVAEQAAATGAFDIALGLRERARALLPTGGRESGDSEIRPRESTSGEEPVEAPGHTITLSVDAQTSGELEPPAVAGDGWASDDGVAQDPLNRDDAAARVRPTTPYEDMASAASLQLQPECELPSAAGRESEAPSGHPPAGTAEERYRAIEEACAEERWVEARNLCEASIEIDPDDMRAVEKLVSVSRHLGDTLATVRALTLLGDLKITDDDLEGALKCFLEVLEDDPQNVTAHRRIARFREMRVSGSEQVPEEYRSSIQALAETKGATVAVRDPSTGGGVGSEEWIDLTTLLQEFRDGIRTQFAEGDHAGHYDLALSHLDMGLYEEALEEFDQVLLSRPPMEVELKTREMRGNCFQRLSRVREAIHEYRMALEVPGCPEAERTEVLYELAAALDAAGEAEEAREILRSLSEAGVTLGEDRLEAA